MSAARANGYHILCLHGGGTNEAVMRAQTAKLRARLRPLVSFHFLQGQHPTHALDPAVSAKFGAANFFSWYDVEVSDRNGRDYVECLLDDTVIFRYPGVDSALAHLEKHIEAGTPCGSQYSAVLGFSQGAVLATLLTARALAGGGAPSWRGVISVAGMPVRANQFRHLFPPQTAPLDFPCVIAQGSEDPFYEWGKRMTAVWHQADVIEYPEGHRFPHARPSNERLASSILRLLEQQDQ